MEQIELNKPPKESWAYFGARMGPEFVALIRTIMRIVSGLFYSPFLCKTGLEALEKLDNLSKHKLRTLNQPGRWCGSSPIAELLERIVPGSYDDRFIHGQGKPTIKDVFKELPLKKGLFFLPMIVKNRLDSRHIVLFTFDPQKKRVDYFDSKGLPPPKKILREVSDHLGKEYKYHYSTMQYQKDKHSCGIWVLTYIQNRGDLRNVDIYQQRGKFVRSLLCHFYQTDTNAAKREKSKIEKDWLDVKRHSMSINFSS